MTMDCFEILKASYEKASAPSAKSFIQNNDIRDRLEQVTLCLRNRAGVRALLAGVLAKIEDPKRDIRKPYTDIAGETGEDCFSGRLYDERYIQQ